MFRKEAPQEAVETSDPTRPKILHVTPGQLLALWYEMERVLQPTSPEEEAKLQKLREVEGVLEASFEAENGAILKRNHGDHVRAGLYYTDRQKLFVVKFEAFPKEAVPFETLLYDIDRAVDELPQLDDAPTRKALGARLGGLATSVLEEIDLVAKAVRTSRGKGRGGNGAPAKRPEHAPPKELLALLRHDFNHARKLHQEAVVRQTKLRYLHGLLLGVALALSFCLALALLARRYPVDWFDGLPVAAVAAGAIGAAISVMMRMGKPDAKWLDATAGRWMIERLGTFRPIIGGVLGAFFFFAVRGGLLPLSVPLGASKVSFFLSIAFLTGFSERLAKNLISSAERTAAAEKDSEEAPATASGGNPPAST